MKAQVVVVGGGASGMMAAYAAAQAGHKVLLLEKNEKLGKKIYITGKGRCNLTNAGDMDDLFSHVTSNRKFLYSAFYAFNNEQTIVFFEGQGMKTKVERGNRVFPESDRASDVTAALSRALRDVGVQVRLNTQVLGLVTAGAHVRGVRTQADVFYADAVILATGGLSYPSTGSTGDGHRMAQESGHALVKCTPSLVPLTVQQEWVKDLQGLSLKNCAIEIRKGKKKLYEDFGEMLFTHFGVSGPMILSASGSITPEMLANELSLVIDLKPALDTAQLDRRILRDFEDAKNKRLKNSMNRLLPARLIPVVLACSGVDSEKPVHEITRAERERLAKQIKGLTLTVTGTRGWNEAIITKGGVSVRDVNPSTMESKRLGGLYLCGELLDVDALTGGYNLQIAWSTGYLAGICIQSRIRRKDMTYNIAIDGPAGAGKSTIAKQLARELNFIYVDTGAMYRALAYNVLNRGTLLTDEQAVACACEDADVTIRYEDGQQQVLLNGENVNDMIRVEEVGKAASVISAYSEVRRKLLKLQQQLAASENLIMDGRDIGTVVLPHADAKIYLTASAAVRAKRRFDELREKGISCDLAEIEKEIIERDNRDMHREISPLVRADDAVLLDSSGLDIDGVVQEMKKILKEKGIVCVNGR